MAIQNRILGDRGEDLSRDDALAGVALALPALEQGRAAPLAAHFRVLQLPVRFGARLELVSLCVRRRFGRSVLDIN